MAITTRDWLTVEEAAGLAKVSEWTVYRACKLGQLRHIRIGGRRAIRLTRESLEEWLLHFEQPPLTAEIDKSPNSSPSYRPSPKPGQGGGSV